MTDRVHRGSSQSAHASKAHQNTKAHGQKSDKADKAHKSQKPNANDAAEKTYRAADEDYSSVGVGESREQEAADADPESIKDQIETVKGQAADGRALTAEELKERNGLITKHSTAKNALEEVNKAIEKLEKKILARGKDISDEDAEKLEKLYRLQGSLMTRLQMNASIEASIKQVGEYAKQQIEKMSKGSA